RRLRPGRLRALPGPLRLQGGDAAPAGGAGRPVRGRTGDDGEGLGPPAASLARARDSLAGAGGVRGRGVPGRPAGSGAGAPGVAPAQLAQRRDLRAPAGRLGAVGRAVLRPAEDALVDAGEPEGVV